MRNLDIPKILNGKTMTGRPIKFKINTQKWHKVISNRKFGAFGEIFVEKAEIKPIKSLSEYEIKMLGYSTIDEYLSEPFNKGLNENSEKKFVYWSSFRPNWRVINQILEKQLTGVIIEVQFLYKLLI